MRTKNRVTASLAVLALTFCLSLRADDPPKSSGFFSELTDLAWKHASKAIPGLGGGSSPATATAPAPGAQPAPQAGDAHENLLNAARDERVHAAPLDYFSVLQAQKAELEKVLFIDEKTEDEEVQALQEKLKELDWSTAKSRAEGSVPVFFGLTSFWSGGRTVARSKLAEGAEAAKKWVGGKIERWGGAAASAGASKHWWDLAAQNGDLRATTERMRSEIDERSFRIALARGRLALIDARLKSDVPWKDEKFMRLLRQKDNADDKMLGALIRIQGAQDVVKYLQDRQASVRNYQLAPGIGSATVGGVIFLAESRLGRKIPGGEELFREIATRYGVKTVRTAAWAFGGTEAYLGAGDRQKLVDEMNKRYAVIAEQTKTLVDLKDMSEALDDSVCTKLKRYGKPCAETVDGTVHAIQTAITPNGGKK